MLEYKQSIHNSLYDYMGEQKLNVSTHKNKGVFMKKIFLFICFFLCFAYLSACSEDKPPIDSPIQTEEPTQPIETNEPTLPVETPEQPVESDPTEVLTNTLVSINQDALDSIQTTQGFEINLYAMTHISLIRDKYFYIYFKEIIYQPISNQLCIIFDYYDEDYERAQYYMIGQEKGVNLTLQQLSYIKSNQEGEHGGCFNFMSKETTYEIRIGKIDQDDLNPSPIMEAVAIIEFIDHNYSERHKIGSKSLNFDQALTYTYDSIPSVSLDISIDDQYEIINQVVLGLYEPETNILLEVYTIELSELKWNNEKLIIDNYVIPNLAPYTDYQVKVYISGHNGIETFTNVLVINGYFTSQSITYPLGYRRHGFFATIIDVRPNDTETTINYIGVNNQKVISVNDRQPYSFILHIYNDENQLIYQSPIDVSLDSISVPNMYAQIGYKIRIVTDRDDLILNERFIEEPAPRIVINSIQDGILYGKVTEGVESINFISIFIFVGNDLDRVDEIEVSVFSQNGSFTVVLPNYQSYRFYDQVLLFYQINYGPMSSPKFSGRELWIILN